MIEIARTGKWNPGGGRWLELLPATGVASYNRPSPSAAPQITLRAGFDWTRIYCSPETLQYRLSGDETDNGDLYTLEIKGFSPDDSPTKALAIIALLRAKKHLIRFCDNAGLIRLTGTPVESLQFSYDLATDPNVAGSRGYALALKGTLTTPPAYA